jgi:hypothetical protein
MGGSPSGEAAPPASWISSSQFLVLQDEGSVADSAVDVTSLAQNYPQLDLDPWPDFSEMAHR